MGDMGHSQWQPITKRHLIELAVLLVALFATFALSVLAALGFLSVKHALARPANVEVRGAGQ